MAFSPSPDTFFLLSVIKDLKDSGIPESNIININLDKRGFKKIKTADALEEVIDQHIKDNAKKYIFIDEIQNVKGFEEVINGYREDGHSVFITGSNSYLLSGELITKLTGRYVEIEMFPLTFYEYLEMKKFMKKEISSKDISLAGEEGIEPPLTVLETAALPLYYSSICR